MPSSYQTASGARLDLGRQLGKGGEGAVFELRDDPSLAAKIYHAPLARHRAEKIDAMAKFRDAALERFCAWPRDLIVDLQSHQPVGLTMLRVPASKDVHNLYGPKSRLAEFPKADWRFLVSAALNIAKAFAVVHDAGLVIGDVNPGSVLVSDNSTVRLIDCDSFQFTHLGKRYPCTVGVETFTPPELQGAAFASVVQSPSHDLFRLAVMVFHLLFLGRHPFAGRYLGAGDMSLGKAIKEFRFAYSVTNRAMQMDRPPGTPALSIVGSKIAGLLELAFSISAISNGRPSARDWIEALEDLGKNLKRCSTNHGHWYAAHVQNCPWCEIEGMGSNALFPLVLPPGSVVDVESLWKQVVALPALGPVASPYVADPPPSVDAQRFKKPHGLPEIIPGLVGWGSFIGLSIAYPGLMLAWVVVGIVSAVLLGKIPKGGDDPAPFDAKARQAADRFRQALEDWNLRTSEMPFQESKRKLETIRTSWSQLPNTRLRKLDELKQNQRNLQLHSFLDRFRIEDAKVKGIGPAKRDVLISYGVETADDIEEYKVLAIPGFGPKTVETLLRWRDGHARKFVFDANKAVDPRDVARVELVIVTERAKLQSEAKLVHTEALQRHATVTRSRVELRPLINAILLMWRQSEVDLQHIRSK